jgi:outer membrane protein OmpA-like peptidoglycan-associated protein
MRKSFFSILVASFVLTTIAYGQDSAKLSPTNRYSIKNNLLYDAAANLNLSAEFMLSGKSSLEIPVSYNPWTFSDNQKWKHFLIQPEYRYWLHKTFHGPFFGLHSHFAIFNVGGLPNSFFGDKLSDYRYQGWLAGAGLSLGYRWNFGSRWGLEANIGAGYAYLDYDIFDKAPKTPQTGSESRYYVGPTRAGLSLTYSFGNKKTSSPQRVLFISSPKIDSKTVEPAKAIAELYVPDFVVSHIILQPKAKSTKKLRKTYVSYLDFAQGKSTIQPANAQNVSELNNIRKMIDEVKIDTNAIITAIYIRGYTSPEGTFENNLELSFKRAFALKNYLKDEYHFPETIFQIEGKGEDWQTLDSLVAQSSMFDKNAILNIIRGVGIFNGREKKLMDLSKGIPYRQMMREIFPKLRRLEITIDYTVQPYSPETAKEILRTNPSDLSLDDVFRIANLYQIGSGEYCEVLDEAANTFVDNDTLNLNAAACALSRKEVGSADKYLQRIHNRTEAYFNNLGILLALRNQWQQAEEAFATAQRMGTSKEAEHNASEIEKRKASLSNLTSKSK